MEKFCSGHYTRGTRSAGYTILYYYSGMKSEGVLLVINLCRIRYRILEREF